jgi:hypothetical protein
MSGCAQYRWVNPNKTNQQFYEDQYGCTLESTKVYPPAFQTITTAQSYQKNSKVNCKENRHHTDCVTETRGYSGPSTTVVDANANNRSNLFNQCMNLKGWRLEEVK